MALKPGTTEPEPGLAESWEAERRRHRVDVQDPGGRHVPRRRDARRRGGLLQLRPLVQLQGLAPEPGRDATTGRSSSAASPTYDKDSGAPEDSLYKSCEATDESTAVLTLTKPSATFIPALSQQAFSIASPKALTGVQRRRGHHRRRRRLHPDGHVRHRAPDRHRPVQVRVVDRGTTGSRSPKYDDYWGDKAKLDKLIIRPIADNAARLQALQTGEIQGYDLVEPQDIATIEGDENLQIIDRPAFNVAYVGFNIAKKPTDDVEGARGDRVRPRPPGGRGQLLLRPRRGGEGVHAAGGRRLRG